MLKVQVCRKNSQPGIRVRPERTQDDFAIREMQQNDIAELIKIEKRSFIAPWTERIFEETLFSPISINFVAKKGDVLLGYIMVYCVHDEAHILNLAVHPDFRNKGYASRLIASIIEYCLEKNIKEIFLEVRESNTSAQNLYKKHGFETIGKRKCYYIESNEDALVMKLALHEYRNVDKGE